MITELYHWYGPASGRMICVDDAYTQAFVDVPVIYFTLFERDQLDTLQLLHGQQIKMISLWDWFDETWDKLHDRTQNIFFADCFHNILTTQRYLFEVVRDLDPRAMNRRKQIALKTYECRNDPPILFTGSLKGYLY